MLCPTGVFWMPLWKGARTLQSIWRMRPLGRSLSRPPVLCCRIRCLKTQNMTGMLQLPNLIFQNRSGENQLKLALLTRTSSHAQRDCGRVNSLELVCFPKPPMLFMCRMLTDLFEVILGWDKGMKKEFTAMLLSYPSERFQVTSMLHNILMLLSKA